MTRTCENRRDRVAPARVAFATVVAAALVLGAWLRLLGLEAQILGGDELHALHAALTLSLDQILTTYQQADKSIPITALLHVLLDAGWRPDELELRALPLASGLILVAGLPWGVRRCVGVGGAGVLAVWLAISPGLVLYSRIFRSYMPMVVLAAAAVIAFEIWWRTGRRRAALAYVALGTGAVWLHLAAGPFVAAPLLFTALAAGAQWIRRVPPQERSGPAWRATFAVGFALACFSLAFLIPAQESLFASLGVRRQLALPSATTWIDVLRLQAGTASGWGVALVGGLAVVGWLQLWRVRPRIAIYTAVLVASQIVGLLVLRPLRFHHPLILNRYLLPCLPVLLLWASCGIALSWRSVSAPGPRWAGTALTAAAVLGALFAAGPLVDPSFRRSAFVHHNDFVGFHRPRGWMDPADVPAFYDSLPAGASLVEAPWDTYWNFARAFRIYQQRTGARVRVSGRHPSLESDVFPLENFVPPDPERLAASPADWVVVHLDVGAEEDRIHEPPGALRADIAAWVEHRHWARLRDEGQALAEELETRWGPADHVEPGLRAWRLPRPPAP